MTVGERLKLFAFRHMSDEGKAKRVIDAYLSGNGQNNGSSEFKREILLTPGLSSGIVSQLKDRTGEVARKYLGDHWYTGLAERFANTDLGRSIVTNKVLDKTLPSIGGSTDTARWFLERGGHV